MASIVPSTVKLVIEKGPRNGETLEFNSRSTIRLGRVVRGNNLTIKDSGISSKHLTIEFNSDSGKWVIIDLDSSNGTILNSSQLKPLSPFEINDGDEIKVGELTAIRVEFVRIGEEINCHRNTRSQAVSKTGGDLKVKVEEEDEKSLNLGDEGLTKARVLEGVENRVESEGKNQRRRGRGRGRGRTKKVGVLEETNGGIEGNIKNVEDVKRTEESRVSTRRTRSSKREEDVFVSLDEVVVPARRTRRAKVVEDKVLEEKDLGVEECKEVENASMVESKRTRGGRGRKKKADDKGLDCVGDVLEDKANREVSEQEVVERGVELQEQPCEEPANDIAQQTGEVSQQEDPEQMVDFREQPCEEPADKTAQPNVLEEKAKEDVLEVEVPQQMGGSLGVREQSCGEPMDENVQQAEIAVGAPHDEVGTCGEPMDENAQQDEIAVGAPHDVVGTRGEPMNENAQQDEIAAGAPHDEVGTCDRLESHSVLEDQGMEESEIEENSKESETSNHRGETDREAADAPDLEKMTLGEWFDYLEVYLPKQIYAVTDEIVEDMRIRARQFDDYMFQQQKEKGKLPLAT